MIFPKRSKTVLQLSAYLIIFSTCIVEVLSLVLEYVLYNIVLNCDKVSDYSGKIIRLVGFFLFSLISPKLMKYLA